MREIVSPLDGIRSPFGFGRSGSDAYAVLGFKPALVADFGAEYYRTSGAATTFDGAVTLTRASSATMVDSSGSLVLVDPNVPRRGHHIWDGTAWVKAGLLVEPNAATNFVQYSDDLTHSSWIKEDGASVTANQSTGITGESTMGEVGVSGGSGFPRVRTGVSFTTQNVCASAVVKDNNAGTIELSLTNSGAVVGQYTFTFSTAALTRRLGATAALASVEDFGGGLYRIAISFAAVTVTDVRLYPSWNDTTAQSFYVEKVQVEEGLIPTSIIPTAGATATRAAETLTAAAADLPYSATAMSIQMDGYMTYADTGSDSTVVFAQWFLDNNNLIRQRLRTDGALAGAPQFLQIASAVADAVSDTSPGSYSPGVNVPFSIASRHGSTFINGAVDGVALTADLTPTALPDLSATNLQLAYSGGPMILSLFRMWGEDLGDDGIATATGAAPVITGVPTIGVS